MGEFVRPARAEDCRALAYHAYLAGKSHMDKSVYDVMFPGVGGPTDARLTLIENLLRTKVVSWFHYTFCSVVEVDGQVASSLCHYHNRDGAYKKMGPALMELGWDTDELKAMAKRMEPVTSVGFPHGEDTMMIENVATSSKYRRRGLLGSLVSSSVALARKQGFKDMRLSVFIGNDPARKAYERMGFEVVEEKRNPLLFDLIGTPGMLHMKLDL